MLIDGVEREKDSWESFYETQNPSLYIYTDKKAQQELSGNTVYVYMSFFTSFSVSVSGGCILVENDKEGNVLIEESYFTGITSSTYGIAFRILPRNVVFNKICGNNCETTKTGDSDIFDYIHVYDSFDSLNQVNLSSYASIKAKGDMSESLTRNYGQIIFESTNISFNECKEISALYSYPSYRSGEISSLVSHCSFSNNSAHTTSSLIRFVMQNDDAKNKIEACNIINNKQKTNDKGLISSESELIINDTCILNNDATLIVSVYNSYSMTIMNSYSDHPSYKTGIVAFETWAEDIFINAIVMFNTGKCIASFDSFGSITAKIDSEKKRRTFCYKSAVNYKKCGVSSEVTRMILCIMMIGLLPS